METALDRVVKVAMELSPEEKITLAGILLESAGEVSEAEAAVAWEAEIQDRIRAVKEGREKGIPYEEVLLEVDRRLGR
jgi:putative addiction module component (TIGR02574 family)